MANFIERVVWFEPNEHTTNFQLNATFADGTQSTYNFTKNGESWEPVGTQDGRLQIILPGIDGKFQVKSYEDDVWSKLQPVYSNSAHSVNGDEVNLIRIVFDRTFDFTTNIIGEVAHSWNLFDTTETKPIYLSSYTQKVVLPKPLYSETRFYGWGLLNETIPSSITHSATWTLDNVHFYAPISWTRHLDDTNANDDSWTVVHREDYGDVNNGLDALMAMPVVNNQYKLIPLYYSSGNMSFIKDTADYRE